MAINMFCGEVKTFFEAVKMDGKCIRGGHENGLLFFSLKGCFYKVIAIEE